MNEIRKWDEINGTDDGRQRMEAFLDSATDCYAILQLRRSDETLYERFSSMRELGRMGLEPNIDHYEVVYVGELPRHGDQIDVLEGLYTRFNIDRPADFKGHSLSVSDIVALQVGGVVSCHYVDSVGFAQLPGFIQRENYLRNSEMALEDDYGMIGVINNGPKQEPHTERVSILEQLKHPHPQERTAMAPQIKAERDER